ncbi:MAG TPA: AAA family ATPase [Candidatus Binataceae bacterium]|jgi:type II secretory pathway predicted ATPase ExeA/phage tail protein X|nr:AAA family ATPase [Candidatus Binataceae bacterium]
MFYRHFGLSGAPFTSTPSPQLFFLSDTHRKARTALQASIEREPNGFSFIGGAPGTGKTAAIISLLGQHRPNLHFAYVSYPRVGFDGFLRDIARQLGVPARTDRVEQCQAFDRYLDNLTSDERAVVIIDDAHLLSNDLLEDLLVFSNLDLNSQRHLHFVLVGQPTLLDRLSAPSLRPIHDRLRVRATLTPLTREESSAYVDYRLAAFGGRADALFDQRALDYLIERSGGIPRNINIQCHNALRDACEAGELRLTVESAQRSARKVADLLAGPQQSPASPPAASIFSSRHLHSLYSTTQGLAPAVVAALLAIVGIGAVHLWNSAGFRGADQLSSSANLTIDNGAISYPAANDVVKADFPGGRSNADATSLSAMPHMSDFPDRVRLHHVRVRAGDTLLTLARTYLGSDQHVTDLINANPQIADIDHIYPGEMLNLPDEPRSGYRDKIASEAQSITPDMTTITQGGQ